MADRPVKNYDGNYITCYPGSNQHDDGKLNLEFNMARLVTRVTSKNFCNVKPSFELTLIRSNKGFPQIQVGQGQCSINGRDIIITQDMIIDAPEKAGTFYLALHLARDPHGNVFGDQIYGVTTTFMGIYLTYFDEKPDPVTDPDILYLGKVEYDGENITSLEEDEDKYGRIWAEDILAKMKDWKHPEVTRMILQDLIYKLPDWYVSKEGDTIFGPLEFLAGRNPDIPGTLESHEDIGTGKYGIRAEAILNEDGTRSANIHFKGPDVDILDPNKTLNILVNNNGVETKLGQSILVSNVDNNFALDLTTPNNINVNSQSSISIIGQSSVSLGTGINGQQPKLLLKDNKATISNSNSNGLVDEIIFNDNVLQHKIGKSIFQYSGTDLSLLGTDTNYFNVTPNTDFKTNIRVKEHIYLGNSTTYGSEPSYITPTQLKLVNNTLSTDIVAGSAMLINPTNNSGYITVKKDNTAYSTMYNTGKIELYNTDSNNTPKILLKNGSSGYDISIEQTIGKNANNETVGIMNLNSKLVKASGDITATGDIRARRVYNAVYNDLVEFMEKVDRTENIEAGDIVYFNDEGKVTKSVNMYSVAGIVSSEDTYGLVLGGDGLEDDEKVPVALAGRVYLKVGDIDIQVGDILGVDNLGNIRVLPEWNRFAIGKATTKNIEGKVYVLVR